MDQRSRIAFLVSGWGLGHATRILALIEALLVKNPQLEISVFTWGPGLEFFRAHQSSTDFQLIELKSYLEKDDSPYLWNSPGSFFRLLKWFRVWIQNSHRLRKYFLANTFDLFVLDSDFHFFSTLGIGSPKVSISQSPYVIEHWKRLRLRTALSVKIKYWIFEFLEFQLQRLFCDFVVSPRLDQSQQDSRAGIFMVPPIVRKEFRGPRGAAVFDTGVAGSGSSMSLPLRQWAAGHQIKYVYDEPSTYGLNHQKIPLIDQYDTLISQCGLSTLSEAMARNCKLILSPIKESPEQIVNAWVMANLGYGQIKDPQLLQEGPKKIRQSTLKPWPIFNGAEVGADVILNLSIQNSDSR